MGKAVFTLSKDKKSLNMERVFSVSQQKLWRAFTEKEIFEQWFAPEGWEVTSKKFEFEEGGENVYIMKCVDEAQGEWFGQTSAGKMVFSDIQPTDSLSYKDHFTDEEGNVNNDMPVSNTTLQFIDNNDGTTTLHAKTAYETEEALQQVIEMGMQEGYSQTLDKLEQLLLSQE